MGLFETPLFQIIGVTILSSAIGVFVKYVSRNDQQGSFKKEDLAIGTDLCVTSIIMIITDFVDKFNQSKLTTIDPKTKAMVDEQLMASPWLILFGMVILWTTSTIIRKKGWISNNDLHNFWGITLPNCVGILCLLAVFMWVKKY